MTIEATLPILFPLKEPELSLQAIAVNGTINVIEVIVEGISVCFNRDSNGYFKNNTQCNLEPAYIAYIERQLSRRFN